MIENLFSNDLLIEEKVLIRELFQLKKLFYIFPHALNTFYIQTYIQFHSASIKSILHLPFNMFDCTQSLCSSHIIPHQLSIIHEVYLLRVFKYRLGNLKVLSGSKAAFVSCIMESWEYFFRRFFIQSAQSISNSSSFIIIIIVIMWKAGSTHVWISRFSWHFLSSRRVINWRLNTNEWVFLSSQSKTKAQASNKKNQ